jgi:hypothetical protein
MLFGPPRAARWAHTRPPEKFLMQRSWLLPFGRVSKVNACKTRTERYRWRRGRFRGARGYGVHGLRNTQKTFYWPSFRTPARTTRTSRGADHTRTTSSSINQLYPIETEQRPLHTERHQVNRMYSEHLKRSCCEAGKKKAAELSEAHGSRPEALALPTARIPTQATAGGGGTTTGGPDPATARATGGRRSGTRRRGLDAPGPKPRTQPTNNGRRERHDGNPQNEPGPRRTGPPPHSGWGGAGPCFRGLGSYDYAQ